MAGMLATTVTHLSHAWTYLVFVFFLAAAVLVATGTSKLLGPNPTARVLAGAGPFSRPRIIARLLGAVELTVGLLAILRPGPVAAAAMAGVYLGFAGFLGFLVTFRPGIRSCGCLGARDVPPNLVHATVDVVAAMVAVAVLHQVHEPMLTFVRDAGRSSVPILAVMGATAYAVYGLIAHLPTVFRSFAAPAVAPTHRPRARQAHIDEIFRRAGIGPADRSLWGGIHLAGTDVDPGTGPA